MISDKDIIIELLRQREDLQAKLSASLAGLKQIGNDEWTYIPDNPPKPEPTPEVSLIAILREENDKLEKEVLIWKQMVDKLRAEAFDLVAERDQSRKLLIELGDRYNELRSHANEDET